MSRYSNYEDECVSLLPSYPTYKRHFTPRCGSCRPPTRICLPPPPVPIRKCYYVPPTRVIVDEPSCCHSCSSSIRVCRSYPRKVRQVRFNDDGCGCGCYERPVRMRRCYKYRF